MKKLFSRKYLTIFTILIYSLINGVNAQTIKVPTKKPVVVQEECTSSQRHKYLMENDLEYKAKREADEAYLLDYSKHLSPEKAVKIIPVVVHVIHLGQAVSTISTPTPNISDAQIQSAIDYMTKAFRAQAPYSGGVDTQIEFCLAKRDENGNPSNGIVRVNGSGIANYSSQGIISSNEVSVKALSQWDNTQFYNVWIVTEIEDNNGGSGTQGYAYFAGASAAYDGAVMLYNAFGYDLNGTIGYNLKSYTNLNITPTHEIGHALNLYHTFEGDGSGSTCPTDAVCGTSGDCCPDTPRHKRSNSDCIVGTNSCTGGSTTEHNSNFMDYSSDGCQTKFSSDQYTIRISPTLVSGGSRYSLTQSNGCNPVYANDASISAVIAPNGSYCKTTFSPIVTLSNTGSATLTTATITYNIDGGTNLVYNWTGSLATNTTINVTLASMTTTGGAHTFNASSSLPNGVADEYTVNDAIAVAFTISVNAIPYTETFEGTFAPTGWSNVSNDVADGSAWSTDGIKQWEKRSTSGNGVSTASAALNCFNYATSGGEIDELISPAIDLNGTTAPELKFNVAHAYYGTSNQERLRVLVSIDCGVTFTPIYDKTYSTLATVGQMTDIFSPTLASHWRLETVDLTAYAGNSVVIKFEGTNGYGNNLYLDDIDVREPCNAPTVGTQPTDVSTCSGTDFSISTVASGVATLTYQWQVSTNGGGVWSDVTDGGVYSTSTTASLTITGVTSGMNSYQYKCIVTNGCGAVTTNASTITVGSTATPTGTASQTYCDPSTVADLVATGTNIQWYAASTGGTALATSTALVTGTTYYATQTLSGCESPSRLAVSVTVNSATTPTGAASQTYCGPETVAILTATGSTIQWYSASTGGVALSTSTAISTGNYYATQTIGSCESATRFAVAVTVNTTPTPTGSASQTFCNAETVADLVASGTAILWYSASTGGSSLATSTVLTTGNYYATQTLSGCESVTRLEVAVSTGGAPTPTGSASQSFCNSATVADLVVTGTTIQWYSVSSGGTALLSSDALTDGLTYYATQTASGCESQTRFAVTVSINSTPTTAPTGSASQTFCAVSTVADLVATGTSILWYSASTGGSALASSTSLSDGVIYYASQTVSGCESATRFAVTATVSSATSAPTGSSTQTFCTASTVSDLVVTGSSIQWYAASTGGSPLLSSDAILSGTSYFASQTVSGCESSTRFEVVVTIGATSAPTGTASQSFCTASTIANLTATGTSLLWYAATTGGTALSSSTSLTTGTTYYASQTVSGCESASRFAVSVTIGSTAAPTGTASQSFCPSATVANLAANGTSILWYAAPTGGSSLASSTLLTNGVTYYASQFLSGCESATRFAVTVTVAGAATPSGSTSQSFCSSGTVANLVATGTSIQWFSTSTGGSALSTTTALVNGSTYYASQTVSGCASTSRLAVAVTIVTTSAPTGSATQSLCPSSTVANLTATGSSIQWYSASTGGSALASSTSLTSGTTYYASQTISGCVSSSRLAVAVTIGSAPAAPTGTSTQRFCGSATVADLTANGTTIQWYASATLGAVLPSSTVLSNGSNYFATQSNGSCESATRFAVSVEIYAAQSASMTILPNKCLTDPAFVLSQGSPVGGIYSGTGVSNGSFNPAVAGVGTFTITYSYTNVDLCTGIATGTILVEDCNGSTGIKELNKTHYLIYPNPSNELVTIVSDNEAIKSVKLFDNSGRLIISQNLTGVETEIKLNLSEYAEGIYTIQIYSESNIVNSQISIKK